MSMHTLPIIKLFTLLKHPQLKNGKKIHTQKNTNFSFQMTRRQSNRRSLYVGDLRE